MRQKYISLFSVIALSIAQLTGEYPQANAQSPTTQRPLTLLQIEKLVANKTPDEVVAGEINNRGIVVRLNDQEITKLKESGAGTKTLQALKNAKFVENQNEASARKPRLWITYAQENKVTGNFDYLAQELRGAGIDVIYKDIALKKGLLLWDQIAKSIEDKNLDGWAILLTRESLQSEFCREELAYALERALSSRGKNFPLLGLVHQVNTQDVPTALRVRGLVDLRLNIKDWTKQVKDALSNKENANNPENASRYIWEIIPNFRGEGTVAIWLRPRFEDIRNWRFFYPAEAKRIDWGGGRPQKLGFAGVQSMVIESTPVSIDFESKKIDVLFVGTSDAATPSSGCYIVFASPFPAFIAFAAVDDPSMLVSGAYEYKKLSIER